MRNFHRKRERKKKISSSDGHKFIVRWIINVTLWRNSAQRVPFPARVVLLTLWFSACVWPWVTSPGKFRDISGRFPPTLCVLLVFYCTSSWVFHLRCGKNHRPSCCLAWEINVCVHTCASMNTEEDVGVYTPKYVFLRNIFTGGTCEGGSFSGRAQQNPQTFRMIKWIFWGALL